MIHGERFEKFSEIKLKFKIFMHNVNGPFRVENATSHKTYKVNRTCLYIFLVTHL